MFIGREKEIRYLHEHYISNRAELLVLYGRRRIGKTETLRQFVSDRKSVFYTCSEITDNDQLKAFSERVLAGRGGIASILGSFYSWEQAFLVLKELAEEKRKADSTKLIVVIDEFPYMCKGNNSIPSILQKLWDSELKASNLMLILCGSAMSFIEKEILGEKNPLYGRATGIYKMDKMNFAEARQFFPKYSFYEQLACYGILGGIPFYLQQFSDSVSIGENIKKHILSRGAILYSEVDFLLRQELRETAVYNSIIQAIALGNNTLSLIHGKTQLENTKITAYLRNLLELGIVKREFSVLATDKERISPGKGLYVLTDSYFKFWYAYVFTNLSAIESGDSEAVLKYIIEPEQHDFLSKAFENVCIEYLQQKNIKDELPFHFFKIGCWWDKVTKIVDGKKCAAAEEIDILATDYRHNKFLLGECKLKNELLGTDVYYRLKEKFPAAKNVEIQYALFSLSGFTDKMKQLAEEENVILVDASML